MGQGRQFEGDAGPGHYDATCKHHSHHTRFAHQSALRVVPQHGRKKAGLELFYLHAGVAQACQLQHCLGCGVSGTQRVRHRRAEHDTGAVTERTYVKAAAENFTLVDFAWVSGRLIVNVNYLDRVGALIVTKTGDNDLANLIMVAELEGLLIPDDFYDNIVW